MLWSLHGPNGSGGVAETVEFVARRGSRRSHFFFFGRGFGSAFFVVPVVLVAAVGGYLMRNPDKARGLKERLKGAWKAGGSTLDSYRYPTPPYSGPHQGPGPDPNVHPGIRPENPWPANPPGFQTGSAGTDSMRFNPPPGWPAPPQDWTPSQDWKPDPSWPPAPPGWHFWVPEQQPPKKWA
ncbi:hypothetical protein BST30_20710 [Mycobacterium mantenii]|uniref:Uncharacterized protein n=1 Tax=Mycobacterium mantenii TaxID=560555 RepID=A0A1X0FJ85_MYCNT|nr:hypothetical protein BST30_20710 [Mycobacterium mantenii]